MPEDYIHIRLWFLPEQADGSPCSSCKDAMYDKRYEVIFQIGDNPRMRSGFFICGPCHDARWSKLNDFGKDSRETGNDLV